MLTQLSEVRLSEEQLSEELERLGLTSQNLHLSKETLKRRGFSLEYETVGTHPDFLVISGLHGDENSIIKLLTRLLTLLRQQTPEAVGSYTHIKRANPKAVDLDQESYRGVNLNRRFKQVTTYEQAKLLIQVLLQEPTLRYVFSFHQDVDKKGWREVDKEVLAGEDKDDENLAAENERNEIKNKQMVYKGKSLEKVPVGFYMYDIPQSDENDELQPIIDSLWTNLKKRLKEEGFALFTGIDNPFDPTLGDEVNDGYVRLPAFKKVEPSLQNQRREVREQPYQSALADTFAEANMPYDLHYEKSPIEPKLDSDGSFEVWATSVGSLEAEGIAQIKHSFIFEVPEYKYVGGAYIPLNSLEKAKMLRIILEEFQLPFMRYVRALEKVKPEEKTNITGYWEPINSPAYLTPRSRKAKK